MPMCLPQGGKRWTAVVLLSSLCVMGVNSFVVPTTPAATTRCNNVVPSQSSRIHPFSKPSDRITTTQLGIATENWKRALSNLSEAARRNISKPINDEQPKRQKEQKQKQQQEQKDVMVVSSVEAGIGYEGCQLPSPSRVNTLPKLAQAKVVIGIFSALFLGTSLLNGLLSDWTMNYEWFASFRATWPITLGLVYTSAGVSHFLVEEDYCNIVPPNNGTWGFWYLPGSAKFHVQWTGVAEVLGGLGLLAGGIMDAFLPVYTDSPNLISNAGLLSDSAFLLFLLTIAVTPSNIYMYTHGAKLPMKGPEVPMSFHIVRGILQVVLLSLLYQMGEGTVDALLL